MSKSIIRAGLVGYGTAGSVFHAPLIRACGRMEISGILTSRDIPGRLSSLDGLIECSDLVVIASPNRTHLAIATQALEAGCHVVVDKPLAVSVDEVNSLIDLAARQKRTLTVFHNRRWDGDFLTVRDLLPTLGDVMLFEANWDRFRPAIKPGWREHPAPGSGVFSDLGPHLIDQALKLFGMPEKVQADILAQRSGAAVDDYFEMILLYGRSRVVLRSSTLVSAPRPRFAVHGTAGSFVKHGFDPQEAQLKSGLDPRDASFGIDRNHGTLTLADGSRKRISSRPGHYLTFYDAVANAILEGAPVPVTAQDARDGLALIDLARRASERGRRLAVPETSRRAG